MTSLALRSCLNPRMALSLDLRWLWSATGTVAALARLAWSAAAISADLAAGGGDHEPGGAEGVNTLAVLLFDKPDAHVCTPYLEASPVAVVPSPSSGHVTEADLATQRWRASGLGASPRAPKLVSRQPASWPTR